MLIDTWKKRNTISPHLGNQLVNGVMPDITRIFEEYGTTVLSAPQPAPVAPQEPVSAKEEPVLDASPAEPSAPAPAATQAEPKAIELDTAAGRIEILIRVN